MFLWVRALFREIGVGEVDVDVDGWKEWTGEGLGLVEGLGRFEREKDD